jgi:DNA-binding response OmpR family regulator
MLKSPTAKPSTKILIAEDSPTQALTLRRTLESRGYDVQVARNGKEALEYLLELRQNQQVWHNHRPAILVTDIVMPEMDGCELCRHIKADEVLKELPVIILTSLTNSRDALRGLYSGADHLVSKPYEVSFLLARVDDILAEEESVGSKVNDKLMPVTMDGQKYFVSGERLRAINLTLTTYETAVQKNLQLKEAEQIISQQKAEIEQLKADLENLKQGVPVWDKETY